MSWQLASFLIVLGSLGAGLWWYERSRPSSKLLAVVATLAALAALGRDAFAAIPDVKPITAIVLVSGVAFGAGPGFAVGALAALASNVLLGEGPWTPWQMLGWGLVGLIGAGLGAVWRARRPPRLILALACALAAEVFNLVVDVYTWTGTGAHTVAGFGLVLGSAAAFDVTHVAASFAFGLAFGPELLSMLARVRARLEVRWEQEPAPEPPRRRRRAWLALPVAGLLAAVGVPVAIVASSAHEAPTPARTARAAVSAELSYLARAQDADGGFGAAPGQESSELYTAWAAMGLAAAGRDPLSMRRDGHSVLDALRGEASSLEGAGDLERTILALHACGVSPRSFPGGDLVTRLLRYRRSDGSFEGLSNLTSFAILALRAAGDGADASTVQQAAEWLSRQQDADGGFGFATRGGGSDVDDTAAVLQALLAAGAGHWHGQVQRGVAYLRRAQDLDGGFPQEAGGASNAQSTAWAVQALVAAHVNPAGVTREGSRSPLAYLESLVQGNGSVRYSRTGTQTPVWVTAQALTALAGRPFPIGPVG